MKILGIIPARYHSSRFEGKPLVPICGIPMIIHVAKRTETALGKENFVIATDDERIGAIVKEWGYSVIMTSPDALTGTDRLWEVAQQMRADVYVNIQGDEPLINPDDIRRIVEVKINDSSFIVNGYTLISEKEDPASMNIPKVIVNEKEELIYISRLPLPGIKGSNRSPNYYKQVCIYAFSYNELKAFGTRTGKTYLESFEDIEIVRFLEMGYRIKMVETASTSLAVDVPSDVAVVEEALEKLQ